MFISLEILMKKFIFPLYLILAFLLFCYVNLNGMKMVNFKDMILIFEVNMKNKNLTFVKMKFQYIWKMHFYRFIFYMKVYSLLSFFFNMPEYMYLLYQIRLLIRHMIILYDSKCCNNFNENISEIFYKIIWKKAHSTCSGKRVL